MRVEIKTILSIVVGIASVFICTASSSTTTTENTEKEIRQLLIKDPGSVLEILDEIEDSPAPSMPQYKIDMMKALAYNELRMFSLEEVYIKKVLTNDSTANKPTIKLQAMSMLLSTESFFKKVNESATMAEEAINLARKIGNKPAELLILQSLANINFKSGDNSTGYKYIHEIINNNNSDNIRILANVSSAYGIEIKQLISEDRLKEASIKSQDRIKTINKIDELGGAPDGFTDQQRAYTYADISLIEIKSGQVKKAEQAYNSFLNTRYGNTLYGKVFITDYLLESGKFKTVIDNTYPLFENLQKADTINMDYHDLLTCNATAYSGLGNHKKAYELSSRANTIKDSLHLRDKSSRSLELATIFKMNEKELALVKSRAELQHKKMLLLMAIGVALIILIGLLIVLRQYHITLHRNKIAAQRIDELMIQKEQVYQFQPISSTDESSKDYMDFVRMEKKIVENSLFLKHNFNRDVIAEECGMTRSKVAMLIQQFAETTPGEYINKLKVQYSVKIIKEHPEWTIDAIAEAAGYTNRSTYYQNFYKVFAITPAQYRKQLEQA